MPNSLAFRIPTPSRVMHELMRPQVALVGISAAAALLGLAGSLVQDQLAAAIAASPETDVGDPKQVRQWKAGDLVPSNVRQISLEDAAAINARNPIANRENPASEPFSPQFASPVDRSRSVDCLTAAVYYEAANESDSGQQAVAQVVLNRMRHVAYPNSICGVVYQGSQRSTGCQFSFTCDGSLARRPSAAGWSRARRVAEAALGGTVSKIVGLSTHYHANYVVPYWSSSLLKTAVIGTHIFYRSNGGAGNLASFSAKYAGVEPDIAGRHIVSAEVDAQLPAKLADVSTYPLPPTKDISEEHAMKLDQFALLDYKKAPPQDKGQFSEPVDRSLRSAIGAAQATTSNAGPSGQTGSAQ